MTLVDQQAVVLITGISASGKSTVAELLAQRFEMGVHVRGDLFRRMIVSGRHEMTDPLTEEAMRQLRVRYRLGVIVTEAYFQSGFSVVVQDVVLGASLATYADMIRSRPLVVVALVPRPDVVERREAERSKVAYRDGHFGIAELDDALRNATPRIGLWLDTSDQTPEQTVDEIVARGLDEGQIA